MTVGRYRRRDRPIARNMRQDGLGLAGSTDGLVPGATPFSFSASDSGSSQPSLQYRISYCAQKRMNSPEESTPSRTNAVQLEQLLGCPTGSQAASHWEPDVRSVFCGHVDAGVQQGRPPAGRLRLSADIAQHTEENATADVRARSRRQRTRARK